MKTSVVALSLLLPSAASFAGTASSLKWSRGSVVPLTPVGVRLHLQSREAAATATTVTTTVSVGGRRQYWSHQNKRRPARLNSPSTKNTKRKASYGRMARQALPAQTKIISPEMYQLFDPADPDDQAREAALRKIPHPKVLTSMLGSWAKSRLVDAPERCYEVLQHLRTHHATDDLAPNEFTYSVVMNAFARRNQPAKAEAVLVEMIQLSGLTPTPVNMGCVMNAWRTSSNHNESTPEKCLRLLELMKEMSRETEGFSLAPIPFNTVMDTYATRGMAKEAENVLNEMLTSNGQDGIPLPDVVSYNTVMKAWWKSNSRDAPENCKRLLTDMMRLSQQHEQLKPNVISLNIVLAGLASRRRAVEAEELLRLMQNEDSVVPPPNAYSYGSVIHAWTKANADDSPDRCLQLLMELLELGKRNKELEPGVITFNSVLAAFANQGRAKEAEDLLRFMMKTGRAPDRVSFNTVMNAWSKSDAPHGPEQCKLWLNQMRQLAERTDMVDCLSPDIFTFNTVIDAYAKRGEGAEAEAMLKEMSAVGVRPDIVSFNSALGGWAKSDVDDAPDQCKRLLSEMYELAQEYKELTPNCISYKAVVEAYKDSGRNEEAQQFVKRRQNVLSSRRQRRRRR